MILDTTRVQLGERSYSIFLADSFDGLGAAITALRKFSKVAILADADVAALYASPVLAQCASSNLEAHLITFPSGESSKSAECFMHLQSGLIGMGMDRKGLVAALGGGVTGDLAGFVAASYMRGIDFIQLPTTVLSLVDSSVGGKTGINHPQGKNLIGAFHQPLLVWGNLTALATLPDGEFASGMAEVIKHGVIRDPNYFALTERDRNAIRALDATALAHIVSGSCRIKAEVVSADEREGGLRAILNFGHTVAHALESLTGYTGYRHGEAVAIGMVAACHLAEELHGLAAEDTARITSLLSDFELPTRFQGLETEAILHALSGDKKTERGVLRFVLPRAIGSVDIVPVTDLDAVRRAIDRTRAEA